MESWSNIRGKLIAALTFIAIIVIIGCDNNQEKIFWSPYQDLNWSEIGHYDSEFHTLPGLGDEQYYPHQTMGKTKNKKNQDITRRDFFKNSSLLVGGGLLLNTLPLFGEIDSYRTRNRKRKDNNIPVNAAPEPSFLEEICGMLFY